MKKTSPSDELIKIAGRVYAETAHAVLFSAYGRAAAQWVPRALIACDGPCAIACMPADRALLMGLL